MKPENLAAIKKLIGEHIEEARSLEDIRDRLGILQRTVNQMLKPKRKLYPVPKLTKKMLVETRDS